MTNFQMVRISELEQSFQEQLTPKDIKKLAKSTRIPREHLIHEIVFAAPKCKMTYEYISWMKSQDIQPDHVKVRYMEVANYIRVHGSESISQFYTNMVIFGHPHQPVRAVRDSRQPEPDSLDESLVYISQ